MTHAQAETSARGHKRWVTVGDELGETGITTKCHRLAQVHPQTVWMTMTMTMTLREVHPTTVSGLPVQA